MFATRDRWRIQNSTSFLDRRRYPRSIEIIDNSEARLKLPPTRRYHHHEGEAPPLLEDKKDTVLEDDTKPHAQ